MSLRLRLTALVTALVAVLLMGLGLTLGSGLHAWTERAVDAALDARASEVLRAVHEESDEDLELHELLEHAGSVLLRVAERDGAVVYASPGFPALAPGELQAARATVTPGAVPWRVRRVDAPGRRFVLHLAAPIDVLGAVERSFAGTLAWVLVLGVLLGGALSALLAHVALRPLSRIAAQISAAEPGASSKRLETQGLPFELRPVVTSFNGLLDRTAAALERERELVARASHALRTPVASVLSEAEVTLRKERTAEEYRKSLETVAGSARQSAALIRELLTLARADAQRPVEATDLQLAPLVDEVAGLVRARAAEKDLKLSVDVAAPLTLRAEPALVREALEALLDNAVTYCPAGASVGVSAREADGHVELTVWDSGPGLAEAERLRAVERFWRGPGTSAQPGSGLGLCVVDAVLRRHGGTLSLEANPGGGLRAVTRWPGRPFAQSTAAS